jgi:hypothetical protein
MGYSVYYNGEIDISPALSDEHATLLDEALVKSNPALLGITAEDGQGLYHLDYAQDGRAERQSSSV